MTLREKTVDTQMSWKGMSTQNIHMGVYRSFITIDKTWKQPRYSLLNEWTNCDVSIQWNIIQH